ncbi:MAG: gluconokinase [Candidatus Obscuribacterales bacterium]|nr:gluconokinase [Candidatus Obscuribacterales bacterium]
MPAQNLENKQDGNRQASAVVIIVMGVAGSGKTAIGKLLSERLHFQFVDADDFHSPISIEKMKSGEPLTDADRAPWLTHLANLIAEWINSNRHTVLACSALKQSYRNILQQHKTKSEAIQFVYLKGSYDLFLNRLQSRAGHYMKADMLKSQFAILEEPNSAIVIDASLAVEEVVAKTIAAISNKTT